jgi:Ca2+-binding RTX toxin-like protein
LAGNDSLDGGTGNDIIDGGLGREIYFFAEGWGNDTITDSSNGNIIDLSAITANLTINLTSSGLNEVTDGTNTIDWSGTPISEIYYTGAGSGDDLIYAGNVLNSDLNGGLGNDTIIGDIGNNTLTSDNDVSNDSIDGNLGDDYYRFFDDMVSWGTDTILDSSGDDLLFLTTPNATTVNLNSGLGYEVTNGISHIQWVNDSIENVITGWSDDLIIGNSGNNLLEGTDGNDTIIGGLGDDILGGSHNNDTYQSFTDNFGVDTIRDLSGTDTLDLSNFNLADVVSWVAVDSDDGDSNMDQLLITFAGGNTITVDDYFNNTTADDNTCGQGVGYIETIIFADDSVVDFVQVQGLIA